MDAFLLDAQETYKCDSAFFKRMDKPLAELIDISELSKSLDNGRGQKSQTFQEEPMKPLSPGKMKQEMTPEFFRKMNFMLDTEEMKNLWKDDD